jgi:cytochrome c5
MRSALAAGWSGLRIAALPAVFLLGSGICAGLSAAELKTGEQVYRDTCFACHATGVANAPKFGDKKAWAPLIKEQQQELTAHAWVGVRGMPAKGGRADLALEEFARAAAYMARAGGASWKDPDADMLRRIREEEKKRIAALKAKKQP